ncbi:tripartite tricarboxylate transporter substrate binding protein [Achromobacter sp. ACM03]|uniref:Bug family tripartite tricarboxylate transporter substrate binding protein n=1 Tax=Achromobacter TaxID=222 RepID=UPI000D459145|nr:MULTISPECIES: tripartite tricarboxylate transporter substrate binding protein [Achromobacter]MBD9432733.1 tripartite tricarboxylate transporter substrate binding protein [Achromobacter sp. ACM03]MDQ1761773.1 tripartite tricarboxylate transporter substrate binding protein [Achromobacter aegrifaciens]PTN48882.1 tripartite tricarboxylate transporter substrate binding protein [Achromobacter xylosoxidans]
MVKHLKTLAAACLAAGIAAPAMAADAYPSKPITIVLPYATGGSADMLARFAAQALQTELGKPAIVEAKPGAGGVLGTEFVSRAEPDGYTLALTASGTMAVNPYVYKLRYKPLEDFKQITVLVDLPFVVVTNNEFPAKNLKEFIDYGRKNPNKITFGNAGLGTQQHLTQLMFARAAGMQVNIVPYKGSSPAMNDLLGGHIDAVLDNTGVQTPFIKAGKVRPLFVTNPERVAALPDVPTAPEAGLPGFSAVAWFGLAAPKGTPDEIVDKIQQALAREFAKPEMKQRLLDLAMIPRVSTPAETTARVQSDLETFGKIAKEVDLKPM